MNSFRTRNPWFQLLVSFLHAIIMLLILFAWNNADYSLEKEAVFLKKFSLLKKGTWLNGLQHKRVKRDDILLVNTGKTGELVPLNEEGNTTWITDRGKLAELLGIIRRQGDPEQIVLCDLLFEIPTAKDSLLRKAIDSIPHIFLPTVAAEAGYPTILQGLPGGPATFTTSTDWWGLSAGLNKQALINRSGVKTISLRMAEQYLGTSFRKFGPLLKNNRKLYFNTIFPDQQVSSFELEDSTVGSNMVFTLSDLLNIKSIGGEEALQEYFRKKIIVIGDFEKDVHTTFRGQTAGSLIVLNTMLSVINEENKIDLLWLIFLTACFSLISKLLFFGEPPAWSANFHGWLRRYIGSIGDNILTNGFWLFLTAAISYIFFNTTIEVIGLVFWLLVVELLMGLYRRLNTEETKTLNAADRIRYVLFNYLPEKKK